MIHVFYGFVVEQGRVRRLPAPRTLYEYLKRPDEYLESRVYERTRRADLLASAQVWETPLRRAMRTLVAQCNRYGKCRDVAAVATSHGFDPPWGADLYAVMAETAALLASDKLQRKLYRFRLALEAHEELGRNSPD